MDLRETLRILREAGAIRAQLHPDGTLQAIEFAPDVSDVPEVSVQTTTADEDLPWNAKDPIASANLTAKKPGDA